MTTPVPGWYPDPQGSSDQGSSEHGASGERWWDGTRWTGNTRPGAAAAPTAYDGFGNPVAPAPVPPAGGPPNLGAPPPYGSGGYGGYGTGGYPGSGSPVGSTPPPFAGGPGGNPQQFGGPVTASFVQRNGYSLATVGVAVLYGLILFFAHFILLGILPLLFGIRAVRRREMLGVPALVVGVLVFIAGLYLITR